jgi:pimeloyl-ACP methyl ester carboxylesterase
MPASLSHDRLGQGPDLVLLHAFPLDRRLWRPQVQGLADCCRLLVPDLPGFGGSSLPEGPLTVEAMARAVLGLLDELDIRQPVFLGGLSMGGYVALALARLHPERIRGLILADTRTEADDAEARAKRDQAIAAGSAATAESTVTGMLPRLLGARTLADKPEVVAEVRRIGSEQRPAGIVAALQALRDRSDTGSVLESLTVPVLVIVGQDDVLTPPALAERMVQRARQGRLVTLPEAGHLSNLEQPEGFNAALRGFVRQP